MKTLLKGFNFVDASRFGMTNWYDDFRLRFICSSKDVDIMSNKSIIDQEIELDLNTLTQALVLIIILVVI